jgi:hypothetical protein
MDPPAEVEFALYSNEAHIEPLKKLLVKYGQESTNKSLPANKLRRACGNSFQVMPSIPIIFR